MIGQAVGLEDPAVADNPSMTFVFFLAAVLLLVLGARFGYYAYRNGAAPGRHDQEAVWWGLAVAGAAAAAYALFGLVEVVSPFATPYRRGLLFAHVVALSFVVQRLCRSALPVDESAWWARAGDRVSLAGVAVAALVAVGATLATEHPLVLLLEGGGALVVATVGFAGAQEGLDSRRVHGTVLDTLLRHLLPVLAFAAAIPMLELAVFAVDRAVVLHVQVVFVVVTATTLMTATIRLRQNLVGL